MPNQPSPQVRSAFTHALANTLLTADRPCLPPPMAVGGRRARQKMDDFTGLSGPGGRCLNLPGSGLLQGRQEEP
jgi:hypothetical protein